MVEVRLYATLRSYNPSSNMPCVNLPGGVTVSDVMRQLGIAPDEVKLIMVNGVNSELSRLLVDGDRLGLFPPVGGG